LLIKIQAIALDADLHINISALVSCQLQVFEYIIYRQHSVAVYRGSRWENISMFIVCG